MAATLLRRFGAAFTLLVAATALVVAVPAGPASADPEGGTKTLRDALESAAKGHIEATAKLVASQKRRQRRELFSEQCHRRLDVRPDLSHPSLHAVSDADNHASREQPVHGRELHGRQRHVA